jgi:hypothetical protein
VRVAVTGDIVRPDRLPPAPQALGTGGAAPNAGADLSAFQCYKVALSTGFYGRRRPLVVVPFAITFAAVMLLIADLDRYGAGFIRVSQLPMRELLQSMQVPK